MAKRNPSSVFDDSLFVSPDVIDREVTLADGRKHKFWFREAPAVDFRRFQIAETSGDEEQRVSSMFRLIAASVCEPDGAPALTVERAMQLKPAVTNSLIAEILAINKMGARGKNGSPPEEKSGSGT